jgi:transposase IS116/IS110/IS902 family protein
MLIFRLRHFYELYSRQVVSYLGLNPSEHSSAGRQRLGHVSKQGGPMLRSLLVEAGQSTARLVPELKRAYSRATLHANGTIRLLRSPHPIQPLRQFPRHYHLGDSTVPSVLQAKWSAIQSAAFWGKGR